MDKVEVNGVMVDPSRVTLVDGIKTMIGDKEVPYTIAKLRPPSMDLDWRAINMAERVMMYNGIPTLMMSQEQYTIAMNMLRIERFECVDPSIPPIAAADIELDMFRRLHPLDNAKIEQGILLYDMAEAVRYGNITQAQFDAHFNPKPNDVKDAPPAPQPEGEAADVAQAVPAARAPRPVAGRLDRGD